MPSHIVIPRPNEEVAPSATLGMRPFDFQWDDYQWLNLLPEDTFYALWLRVPSTPGSIPMDLEPGHRLYVVTFHYEHIDTVWLLDQCQRIKEPIIVLGDGSDYDFPWPSNVHFYNFYSWHIFFEQIMAWFPDRRPRDVKYKVSAVCNRITQSKLLVTTALLENFERADLLIKLGTWLEEKNVHHRQHTGNKKLDDLSDVFFSRYFGQEMLIDDFSDKTHNFQRRNSDPWQPLYLESAIHLTNESYHYSHMIDPVGPCTRPGPYFSEKTFKCLLAGCPFLSVGQFDSYRHLQQLGLKFDYGAIDLSWDQDPGNLSRLSSLIDAIIALDEHTIGDLVAMTQDSSQHNQDLIWSGEFSRTCRAHNEKVAQGILQKFS